MSTRYIEYIYIYIYIYIMQVDDLRSIRRKYLSSAAFPCASLPPSEEGRGDGLRGEIAREGARERGRHRKGREGRGGVSIGGGYGPLRRWRRADPWSLLDRFFIFWSNEGQSPSRLPRSNRNGRSRERDRSGRACLASDRNGGRRDLLGILA
jgi:hypothetical protein